MEDRGDAVVLRVEGIEAVFPGAVRSSLVYHCFENGDSIDELRGFLATARASPGMLLDVGAADGLFATLYCLACRDNRAIAYEPSSEMYPHLVACVELNNLADRMTIVNAAVGRTDEAATGHLNPAGMLILTDSSPATTTVQLVSLDRQVAEVGPPRVIKIDVEGYEGEVLGGASQLLSTHKPILFLEFHLDIIESNGGRVDELLKLLTDLGYQFETSLGSPLTARAVAGSPKAIIRFVARPRALQSRPSR
jgi:FkbM family methyltransferase